MSGVSSATGRGREVGTGVEEPRQAPSKRNKEIARVGETAMRRGVLQDTSARFCIEATVCLLGTVFSIALLVYAINHPGKEFALHNNG